MNVPCRCVNCDYDADGEDMKCSVCRERPEDPVACVFLSDDEYRLLKVPTAASKGDG